MAKWENVPLNFLFEVPAETAAAQKKRSKGTKPMEFACAQDQLARRPDDPHAYEEIRSQIGRVLGFGIKHLEAVELSATEIYSSVEWHAVLQRWTQGQPERLRAKAVQLALEYMTSPSVSLQRKGAQVLWEFATEAANLPHITDEVLERLVTVLNASQDAVDLEVLFCASCAIWQLGFTGPHLQLPARTARFDAATSLIRYTGDDLRALTHQLQANVVLCTSAEGQEQMSSVHNLRVLLQLAQRQLLPAVNVLCYALAARKGHATPDELARIRVPVNGHKLYSLDVLCELTLHPHVTMQRSALGSLMNYAKDPEAFRLLYSPAVYTTIVTSAKRAYLMLKTQFARPEAETTLMLVDALRFAATVLWGVASSASDETDFLTPDGILLLMELSLLHLKWAPGREISVLASAALSQFVCRCPAQAAHLYLAARNSIPTTIHLMRSTAEPVMLHTSALIGSLLLHTDCANALFDAGVMDALLQSLGRRSHRLQKQSSATLMLLVWARPEISKEQVASLVELLRGTNCGSVGYSAMALWIVARNPTVRGDLFDLGALDLLSNWAITVMRVSQHKEALEPDPVPHGIVIQLKTAPRDTLVELTQILLGALWLLICHRPAQARAFEIGTIPLLCDICRQRAHTEGMARLTQVAMNCLWTLSKHVPTKLLTVELGLVKILLVLSAESQFRVDLQLGAARYLQAVLHDRDLLADKVAPELLKKVRHEDEVDAMLSLVGTNNTPAQVYALSVLTQMGTKNFAKRTMAREGGIELLLQVIREPSHREVLLGALQTLLNISTRPANQVRTVRAGTFCLIRLARSSDAEAGSLARAILMNCKRHPKNRTLLYRAELKVKAYDAMPEKVAGSILPSASLLLRPAFPNLSAGGLQDGDSSFVGEGAGDEGEGEGGEGEGRWNLSDDEGALEGDEPGDLGDSGGSGEEGEGTLEDTFNEMEVAQSQTRSLALAEESAGGVENEALRDDNDKLRYTYITWERSISDKYAFQQGRQKLRSFQKPTTSTISARLPDADDAWLEERGLTTAGSLPQLNVSGGESLPMSPVRVRGRSKAATARIAALSSSGSPSKGSAMQRSASGGTLQFSDLSPDEAQQLRGYYGFNLRANMSRSMPITWSTSDVRAGQASVTESMAQEEDYSAPWAPAVRGFRPSRLQRKKERLERKRREQLLAERRPSQVERDQAKADAAAAAADPKEGEEAAEEGEEEQGSEAQKKNDKKTKTKTKKKKNPFALKGEGDLLSDLRLDESASPGASLLPKSAQPALDQHQVLLKQSAYRISFADRHRKLPQFDNRKPTLHLFEHVEGSKVCEDLYEHYTTPDGKCVHFYHRRGPKQIEDKAERNPPPPPLLLEEICLEGLLAVPQLPTSFAGKTPKAFLPPLPPPPKPATNILSNIRDDPLRLAAWMKPEKHRMMLLRDLTVDLPCYKCGKNATVYCLHSHCYRRPQCDRCSCEQHTAVPIRHEPQDIAGRGRLCAKCGNPASFECAHELCDDSNACSECTCTRDPVMRTCAKCGGAATVQCTHSWCGFAPNCDSCYTELHTLSPEEEVFVWELAEHTRLWKGRAKEAESKSFFSINERVTNKCFRTDWERVVTQRTFEPLIPKVLTEGETVESCLEAAREVFLVYFPLMCNVFEYYAATGSSGSPFEMSSNSWNQFCALTCIEDDSMTCNRAALDTLFVVVNLGDSDDEEEDDGGENNDNTLVRFEFVELMLRVAAGKYCFPSERRVTLAQGVRMLFEQCWLPNLTGDEAESPDTFRKDRLYTEEVDIILAAHARYLEPIFERYAPKTILKGRRKNHEMLMSEWMRLMEDLRYLDADFTKREAIISFIRARMRVSDEMKMYEKHTRLGFLDFLEALGRVVDAKSFPTDEEMANAGVPDDPVAFIALFNAGATDANGVPYPMEEPPEYGEPNDRPLWDRLEKMLDTFYYELHKNLRNDGGARDKKFFSMLERARKIRQPLAAARKIRMAERAEAEARREANKHKYKGFGVPPPPEDDA